MTQTRKAARKITDSRGAASRVCSLGGYTRVDLTLRRFLTRELICRRVARRVSGRLHDSSLTTPLEIARPMRYVFPSERGFIARLKRLTFRSSNFSDRVVTQRNCR